MEAVMQLQNQVEEQTDYIFNTDKFTYAIVGKAGQKSAYVTGYISTTEQDLYDDIITPEALKSMLAQIESSTITLDYEHEAFRDDNTILPVGKIIEAKIDDRGLWVKCKLNKFSPKYKALWGSIQDEFVNAFSIAFKPLKVTQKMIGDTEVRLIEDLVLLNVALTGIPVNQGAVVDGYDMKSIMLKAINDTKEEQVLVSKKLLTKLMEVKSMEENTKPEEAVAMKDEAAVEAPVEAPAVEEAKPEEAKPEEAEEVKEAEADDAPVESEAKEDPVEAKALAELTANVEKLAKENAELKSDLKALKETEVFKSPAASQPDLKSAEQKAVDMVSLIR